MGELSHPYLDALLCALVWPVEPIPSPLPTLYQGHSPIGPCESLTGMPQGKSWRCHHVFALKKLPNTHTHTLYSIQLCIDLNCVTLLKIIEKGQIWPSCPLRVKDQYLEQGGQVGCHLAISHKGKPLGYHMVG